ncbi:DNA/RNA polymerases superfamily protein [Gossypium australe]|uniref:DNA/RNA polymerases superfamily protein n=1 Tax=Gossypium australe TaxID=47621 RepID=A0A5B6X3J6_9ROSI|nr:DNA/RNA polymerases superfamily protein [Gossypium australe]
MDFVSGLPLTLKKKDVIWVVVDRLTKSTHFIPVRTDYSLDRLAKLYISVIVRLHGKKLQEAVGTMLNFSTAFHPQTDGQTERVIQILEDMLRCCVLEFEGSWEKYLPLIEFAYNISFQSSIKMAFGKKIHGVELIREIEEKLKTICDSLKEASDPHKSYVDLKRKEIEFQVRDRAFLKVSLWKKIVERIVPIAYRLALPPELEKIRNVFHISMLCRYRSDPSHVISPTNFLYNEESIRILAREMKELRNKCIALVKVLWHKHGIEEAT